MDKKEAEIRQTGSELILLIENEQAHLNMPKKILERLGYSVVPENTTGEAIQFS